MHYAPRQAPDSVLYKVVQENLRTFLEATNFGPERRPLPGHVRRAFWKFLDCGVIQKGFARVQCEQCKHERLVPFS